MSCSHCLIPKTIRRRHETTGLARNLNFRGERARKTHSRLQLGLNGPNCGKNNLQSFHFLDWNQTELAKTDPKFRTLGSKTPMKYLKKPANGIFLKGWYPDTH